MLSHAPISGSSLSDFGWDSSSAVVPVTPPDGPEPNGPLRLLYEDLPLRTSRMLGDFATDEPLAHVFGDLTAARFPLVRVSATRGHAADHPMEITGAGSGTTPTDSWEAKIEADITGHVCTFVDFLAPVPPDDQMWAYGRGRRNFVSGVLLTNVADIMEYIGAFSGRSDRFQQLREQCAAAGIALAGRMATIRSIRSEYDVWAQCAGAIWCPGMGRRYPSIVSGFVRELDVQTADNLDIEETSDDTADILRVSYDWCDATNKPQKFIELTASPQRFGGLVKELSLPMLRAPQNAVTVCGPILQRLAGRRYTVTLDSSEIGIRPGEWQRIVDHPDWSTKDTNPYVMALTVDVDRDNGVVHVSGEFQATRPAVNVTSHSLALPDSFTGALDVAVRDGVATFTVLDENKRGIVGARVSLDGGAPKTTDSLGQVRFVAVAGVHEVAIEAPGYVPMTLQVTL